MKIDVRNIREKLIDEGYKLTWQRKAILDTLIENKESHLTPEQVYEILIKTHPNIGIATVYRTLHLFNKLDIIFRLDFDDGYNRYELKCDEENHQHHHLICLNCNEIIEVRVDLLDSLELEIEKENKFRIVNHNLKFFGYCSNCNKE